MTTIVTHQNGKAAASTPQPAAFHPMAWAMVDTRSTKQADPEADPLTGLKRPPLR
jgi:hypothetical protein